MTFNSLTYSLLTPAEFPHFHPYLPASFRIELDDAHLAFGAYKDQERIGIVYAKQESDRAELLFLFVKEEMRNQGIGTHLMRKMQAELIRKNCSVVTLLHLTKRASHGAVTKILQKCQWTLSSPNMFFYEYDFKPIENKLHLMTLLPQLKLPPNFQISNFETYSSNERKNLEQQKDLFYPKQLAPFQEEELIEPLNSLWLRHHGQIVGWMITHRIYFDTIRYTSLFVAKQMQSQGRAIPLLLEAVSRQLEFKETIPYAIQAIPAQFEGMVKFAQKRLVPFTFLKYESREAHLNLLK